MIKRVNTALLQKKENVDEVAGGISDIVITDTYEISDRRITSEPTLRMNVTSNTLFKCEFATMDHEVISEAVIIDWEGTFFLSHTEITSKYDFNVNHNHGYNFSKSHRCLQNTLSDRCHCFF